VLDIPGYQGSRPVRSGNSAAGQTQLGTYGDFFDTIYRYVAEGHLLDPDTGQLLASLADRCCDRWHNRDSGMWELGQLEHYTISKIGCWVALDRAVRLVEAGQIPHRGAERWATESHLIRDWVEAHCWSEAKHAYTFYAGTDDLDAAVLLAGRTGFEQEKRLASTIDAVADELGRGPLLYRYTGMEAEEGAFVACTFWMVEALVYTGQLERARRLMDEGVALVNDVGLLSEQIDPETGAFLGNTPQGLSHLALINAAFTIERGRTNHGLPGESRRPQSGTG
jgi:GH15 family glucan-1,4-alpha-glucosidase